MELKSDQVVVHPTLRNFLYGQYANLFKFALWWTTLAPLTFALVQSGTAIGVGRIVYNTALCLLSPIGGLLVEHVHPRTILLRAAGVRFLIWCILVPATWFLFDTSLVCKSHTVVYVLLNFFLFFDGAAVALSNILDIDLVGLDIVSGRYGIEVSDALRNYFNTRQEFFFASCFVIFAPGMAFLGLAIKKLFEAGNATFSSDELEAGTLTALFFLTFLFATFFQFLYFRRFPLEQEAPRMMGQEDRREQVQEDVEAPPTLREQIKGIPSELWGALVVLKKNPPILFRLIFLGIEIAVEDAAIVVVAAQMGIQLPWLGDHDAVQGNIWTSIGVASGKLGGAVASLLMMKCYTTPSQPKNFIHLFVLILLSTVVMFIFPLIVEGHDNGSLSDDAARALYLLGFFVYFFLSTLPKLGLMGLLQSMVMQVENGPRVFGFVAVIATSFDALFIMALSVLFVQQEHNLKKALYITAFIYLAHGVLEFLVGPSLVLRPMQRKMEDEMTAEGEKKPPEEDASLVPGPQTEEPGSFSSKTATVPIAVGKHSNETVTGIMSTSVNAAFAGSVTRRRSGLDASTTSPVGSPTEGGVKQYVRVGSALSHKVVLSQSPSRRGALE